MSYKELKEQLEICKEFEKERDEFFKYHYPESYEFLNILFDKYVQNIAKMFGDESNWIDWYIYENEYGKRKLEAGEKGNLKPIKNVKDLYKLIVS